MSIKVSVIVPAYNVEDYIPKTIESLIKQQDDRLEIIVVNDGSKDATLDVTTQLLENSTFTNYKIINKDNGGVSSARNRGISEASGDFLYFLDADDYVSEDWFKAFVTKLDNIEADVIAWGFHVVDLEDEIITNYNDFFKLDNLEISGPDLLTDLLSQRPSRRIWTGSALYRRSLIMDNEIKFDENCVNGEDLEFIFKALLNSKRIQFIEKILSYYVRREGSISNSYNIRRFDAIGALNRVENALINSKNKVEQITFDNLNRFKIDIYLANYHSCYLTLNQLNPNQKSKNIKKLNHDIESKYSGLIKQINKDINKLVDLDLKKKVKYSLYKLSPGLYLSAVERL